MPELLMLTVDTESAGGRERVAACFASEGGASRNGPARAALLDHAERDYARLIDEFSKRRDAPEVDQLALARFRVAWSTVIYRFQLASELDRFDAASGFARPAQHTIDRLRQALQSLRQAERELAGLRDVQKRDADRFLLLGIGEEFERLSCDCLLNAAWARLWAARLAPEPTKLADAFSDGLKRFDDLARSACETQTRDAAALGSAICLRMLARHDESAAALGKLIAAKPPYVINVRAHIELARAQLAARQFAEARATLGRLTSVDAATLEPAYASAAYDIELSRLLHADSYLRESEQRTGDDREKNRRAGIDALARLASKGGAWGELADVYLTAHGAPRDPAERSGAELAAVAQRLMSERKYAEAIALWRTAVAKLPPGAGRIEANFNLAVCLYQTGGTEEAARMFSETAALGDKEPLAVRAADHAYRCRAKLAGVEKSRAAYAALADAAEVLLRLDSKHQNTDEIMWIRAAANEEGGRADAAEKAYAALPSIHRRYWEARRRMVDCRAARLAATASASNEATAQKSDATLVAAAYRKLAVDLRAAAAAGDSRAEGAAAFRAELDAAEWLATTAAGEYAESLKLLGDVERQGEMPAEMRGRLLAIRIRCHRGLNQLEQAAAVLDEFLRAVPSEKVGDTLIGLAAGMESEIDRLQRDGRDSEARRMAVAALPTMRQLLNWIEQQPDRAADKPVVRFSLARVLEQAGQTDEAILLLDELMKGNPRNGAYLQRAATLRENRGRAARAARGDAGLQDLRKSEELWGSLLSDGALRESNPTVYWEARYRWLRLRLENSAGDQAAEIAKAIDAERAWFPALGGPPWAGRLMDLADQARAAARRKGGE